MLYNIFKLKYNDICFKTPFIVKIMILKAQCHNNMFYKFCDSQPCDVKFFETKWQNFARVSQSKNCPKIDLASKRVKSDHLISLV